MATNSLPPQKKERPRISTKASGAFVHTVSTVRYMKMYSLSKAEMKGVTLVNTLMSFLGSIGTILILLAIGLKQEAMIEGTLTEQARLYVETWFWVFLSLGLVSYLLGVLTWFWRRSMLQSILDETKVIEE